VRHSAGKQDRTSRWVNAVKERRGTNKAAVALANKNARMIWALLQNQASAQTA
jgi:transposase